MKTILFLVIFLSSFTAIAQTGQWQLCNTNSCNYYNHSFLESQGKVFSTGCTSLDSGATWTVPSGGVAAYSFEKNSAGIFAGTSSAIYFSNDNGINWTNVLDFGTLNFVFDIANINDTIFAATRSSGIWMTPDNGSTWTAMNSGLPSDSVYSIFATGNLLYAGTFSNGIYKSDDSGLNWLPVNNGLPMNAIFTSITADNANIYAATYTGLFYSNNSGASWVQANIPTTHVKNVLAVGNAILAGGYNVSGTGGLFRSLDNGNTWNLYEQGLPNSCPYVVGALYATSTHVFLGLGEALPSCSSTDIYRIDRNDVTTNLAENSNTTSGTITVFPNPFSDETTITFSKPLNSMHQVLVHDVSGREIQKWNHFTGSSLVIKRDGLGTGMYFCMVIDGEGNVVGVEKLVVQ